MREAIEMAADHPGAAAALSVLLMGLRDEEICRARVGQVERDGCFLVVTKAKADGSTTGLSIRIPRPLRELLAQLSRGKAPTAPLFPHEDGGFPHARWVGEWVRQLCHRAEVPIVSPTALRLIHATSTTGMPASRPGTDMPGAEA